MVDMALESWESILYEFGKGGPKGGPGESQFKFEIPIQNRFFFVFTSNFKLKLAFGPPFGTSFPNLQSMDSQLSLEKKN